MADLRFLTLCPTPPLYQRACRTVASGNSRRPTPAREVVGSGTHATRAVLRALWRGVIAACCVGATVPPASTLAAGQPSLPLASNVGDPLMPVSPAVSLRVYQQVDGWVRAMQTDAPPDSFIQETAGISASCVVLRYDGAIVGRGVSFVAGAGGLRQAAAEAIEEARRRIPGMTGHDAKAREELLAPRITVSLELASVLIPISPQTFDEVDLIVRPGLEGVAARWGANTGGVFPSQMMYAGQSASDAVISAISSASGDPTLAVRPDPRTQPPMLAEKSGVSLFKFVVSHLAQRREGQQPTFMWRGGRVIEQRELTRDALKRFADGMAARLVGSGQENEDTALRTTFWTLRGTATGAPSVADDALRAMALAAWLRTRHDDIAAEPGSIESIASRFVRRVSQQPPSEDSVGAVGMAFDAVSRAIMAKAASDMLRDAALAWSGYGSDGAADAALARVCSNEGEWAPGVPEAVRGYMVYGLAARATDPRLSDEAKQKWLTASRAGLRAVYREAGPGMLVSHMPWIGWAELAMLSPQEPVPAAVALRGVRDLVWEHQLRPEDVMELGPDLAGGVVFTASRMPVPTWHTSRVAAFLATMMGDSRLTDPEEELREITHVMASLRFLRQLAADEDVVWASAAPQEALWGVRAALWDQRQTPEATAMTLLAVCETIRSLEAIAARQSGRPGR